MNREALAQTFLAFAERECRGSSTLYERLSRDIAQDAEMLQLCGSAREGQPVPNLLFGAVHYLLLKGKDHRLKAYYPDMAATPLPSEEAFEPFRDFCRAHRTEIEELLRTRLVQTNEVRRCGYLYPVFGLVHRLTNKPLGLIEIGTSAGLQLMWDRYAYTYGQRGSVGDQDARLRISSEIIGEATPRLPETAPPVSHRIGLDLNIVDLKDEDERLWLKALIWPEHEERLTLFERAARYIDEQPLQLVEGDGVHLLPAYASQVGEESALCIFHTHVANQMPLHVKKELLRTIEEIGREREVFHIYNNVQDRYLHLDRYQSGVVTKQTIAETDGHGRWFKWLLAAAHEKTPANQRT
ncbi:DUF2332 domain-containing protein [Exiguobacterium flavidum]|uniref:DUF2332 domain-containing protein n=1 Tax=Exiguobacterium flavidum TaxID=2184695 RepID=UPI000DF7FF1A|nr:DUF2332 domain-containing protein [Exiguobacterium flavidum]